MKKLFMQEYSEFVCIGSSCTDTCCAGWNIYIDAESAQRYRKTGGTFGKELQEEIRMEEGKDSSFRMNDKGRCPFLNEENLCRIILTLGEDALCKTCKTYPRVIYRAGDILFGAISLACPEAARRVLEKKEIQQYDFQEDGEEEDTNGTDWGAFNTAIRVYSVLQGILQERKLSIRERLSAFLIFSYQCSEMIGTGKSIDGVTELFQQPEQYLPVIRQVLGEKRNYAEKLRFIQNYITVLYRVTGVPDLLKELEKIRDDIMELSGKGDQNWEEAFRHFDEQVPAEEQERLLVYLLFRHFMAKYRERDVWENALFVIMFYSAYRCLTVLHYLNHTQFPDAEWRILLIARISRIFEHASGIWDKVYERISAEGMDRLDWQLRLVD